MLYTILCYVLVRLWCGSSWSSLQPRGRCLKCMPMKTYSPSKPRGFEVLELTGVRKSLTVRHYTQIRTTTMMSATSERTEGSLAAKHITADMVAYGVLPMVLLHIELCAWTVTTRAIKAETLRTSASPDSVQISIDPMDYPWICVVDWMRISWYDFGRDRQTSATIAETCLTTHSNAFPPQRRKDDEEANRFDRCRHFFTFYGRAITERYLCFETSEQELLELAVCTQLMQQMQLAFLEAVGVQRGKLQAGAEINKPRDDASPFIYLVEL